MDWGHLLDNTHDNCSPECDVIIHRQGFFAQWNGKDRQPIMDFKFIDSSESLATVSCKSTIRSIDQKHVQYLQKMGNFQKNIFLFSECCEHKRIKILRKNALEAGYKGFWCLYTIDRSKSIIERDEPGWQDFFETVYRAVTEQRNIFNG